MPTVVYVCVECGKTDKMHFANSDDECYADDCMVEQGWLQDSENNWHCDSCCGGATNAS